MTRDALTPDSEKRPSEAARVALAAAGARLQLWLSKEEFLPVLAALDAYDALAAGIGASKTDLTKACDLYCSWFDTGKPMMDGGMMAYELVSAIRTVLVYLSPRGIAAQDTRLAKRQTQEDAEIATAMRPTDAEVMATLDRIHSNLFAPGGVGAFSEDSAMGRDFALLRSRLRAAPDPETVRKAWEELRGAADSYRLGWSIAKTAKPDVVEYEDGPAPWLDAIAAALPPEPKEE